MNEINTHNYKMRVGKHAGALITRVPISYLRWMVNEKHTEAAYARAELARRNTTMPQLEISGHAIDSASLRIRKTWHTTSKKDEGLHAWLHRVAIEARTQGMKDPDEPGKFHYIGVTFVFVEGDEFPVLKTVMSHKGGRDDGNEAGTK